MSFAFASVHIGAMNGGGCIMARDLLTAEALARRFDVDASTIWRWHARRPDFPRAIRLGGRCTRWRVADMEAWEAAQAVA